MSKVFISFLLFFLFISNPLFASRVGVVLTEKNPVYDLIVENFENELKLLSPGVEIEIFVLGNDNSQLRKRILDFYPMVNFSIGKAAAEFCDSLTIFPFVFTMVLNPENANLIQNKGKHDFFTGIKVIVDPESQFTELKKSIPGCKIIGTLYSDQTDFLVVKGQAACKSLGLELEAIKVNKVDEVYKAFRSLLGKGIDCFWLQIDTNILGEESLDYFIQGCEIRQINLLTFNPNHVKSGASIAVYLDYAGLGIQAAHTSSRILKGESAASIPITEAKFTKTSVHPKNVY